MYQKNKELIRQLYQRSWEMELLISGFSLVFLAQSFDSYFYIVNGFQYYVADGELQMLGKLLAVLAAFSGFALSVFLFLNLMFRAYWVALIGIVSSIDKSNGRLSFSAFRRQNIQQAIQFRQVYEHIGKVDKIGSQLFGLALLVVCFTFSMVVFITETRLINLLGAKLQDTPWMLFSVQVLAYTFLLLTVIYLFDLFSRGLLSRATPRWIHVPNYYIGRVMRIALGVFLFEKVVLTLHKSSWLGAAMAGIVVIGFFYSVITLDIRQQVFDFQQGVLNESQSRRYKIVHLDEYTEWGRLSDIALQHKIFQQLPVRVFLPLTKTLFTSLRQFCPQMSVEAVDSACINRWAEFAINEQPVQLNWMGRNYQDYKTLGLEAFYYADDLTPGIHTLSVKLPFLAKPLMAKFGYFPQASEGNRQSN